MKKFVKGVRLSLIHIYHGGSGTLAVTCLAEPELAFLHGQLHVLRMDETYKNAAPSYTVNFNIAQRTKKAGYYRSGEYYRQDAVFKKGNDIYDRYNMRAKVDFQLTDVYKRQGL